MANRISSPYWPTGRFTRPLAFVALAAGLLALTLATMPWHWLKDVVASRLSAALGAPVTIGAAARTDWLSYHPRVELRDVRMAQPAWAGIGDLARVRRVAVRFAALPLLIGRMRVESIELDGLTLNLVRDAAGRWNTDGRDRKSGEGGGAAPLDMLVVRDGRVTVADAKRRMTLDAALSAGPGGVRLDGRGTHRDRPMQLAFRGGRILPGRPWPVRAALSSPLLWMRVAGTTEGPLALDRLDIDVRARADDARLLDDVIEAGLPGTQAVTLAAHVRRDRPDWHITRMAGRIGRSHLAGTLDVAKRDGRTTLTGALDFADLDFDDLASDAQRRTAAARQRVTGVRVLPETPIHFEKLGGTDGTLHIRVRRLLFPKPTLFRTIDATLRMDRRRLTIDPFRVGLTHGALSGPVSVDHRAGEPKLRIDLTLSGARLQDVLGADPIMAPVRGRIVLAGTGRTIRSAIGRADGRVGIVATGGSMDRTLATFASGDILKSIGQVIEGRDGQRVPVRCVVARFRAANGRMAAGPMVLDAGNARADGSGTIMLANERIALAFTGRAKDPGAVQTDAPLRLVGTLSAPEVEVVPQSIRRQGLLKKVGALFKSLSTGKDRPVAAPADCARLTAEALK